MISLEALAVIAPIFALVVVLATVALSLWYTERAERRRTQR